MTKLITISSLTHFRKQFHSEQAHYSISQALTILATSHLKYMSRKKLSRDWKLENITILQII